MTDESLSLHDYKITVETFNGFFGAWLKCNWITRQRLFITLVVAVALSAMTTVTSWQMLMVMINEQNMPLEWKLPLLAIMATVELLLCFLMATIPVYILSPIASYLWLIIVFLAGPVQKRRNNAEISDQGITKSFATHSHTTPWDAIYEIVETRKTLLIFTNRNSAMMIPKQAFPSPEAAETFATMAKRYWDGNHSVF